MNCHAVAVLGLMVCMGIGCAKGAVRQREQANAIAIDGRFGEWQRVAPLLSDDPSDAGPGSAVDIGIVQAADDPQWLYLAISVGDTVNAQAMRGTLQVLFDDDDDPGTGSVVSGMTGVDAAIELSPTDSTRAGGIGAGVMVRAAVQSTPGMTPTLGALQPGDLADIVVAPTHSAPRFELRVRRGAQLDSSVQLIGGDRVRLKLVFRDEEGVRDTTGVVSYDFRYDLGAQSGALPPPSIEKSAQAFRVLQWNVASERFRERPDAFARVIAALNPDVVMLDEVFGTVTSGDLERFFARPRLVELGRWQFVLGQSGGRQKTVVASREPIRPALEMADIRYPIDSLDQLDAAIGDAAFSRLVSLERQRGIAAVGAWVELHGREVLFVALDLQSAGYHRSPRDRLRELQAFVIREHILSALGPASAATMVAGDFNLVGSIRPLEVLASGLDVDGSALTPVDTYRLGDAALVTWRSVAPNPFTPGRLDFILYPDMVLEPVSSFAFDTDGISAVERQRLDLESADSRVTSDHLPLVADFRWR